MVDEREQYNAQPPAGQPPVVQPTGQPAVQPAQQAGTQPAVQPGMVPASQPAGQPTAAPLSAGQPAAALPPYAAQADEEASLPPSLGRKINLVICGLAFLMLFGYLFIAGEGEDTLDAISRFNWSFLLIALVGIVVFWLLESVCMQIISNYLYPGFSFVKTFIVTIIGQYFNSITPLSSGGQPMQAYYYKRFGMPLSDAMTMLLCRFIVYQFTMTIYAVIVLVLRFRYFTETLRPLMYLVGIGFLGGLVLMTMLLALAFAKNTVTKGVVWLIRLLARFNIVKDAGATIADACQQLDDAYNGMRVLLGEPVLLLKVAGVTFVQLTVYFSLSYVIFVGFKLETNDYFTVVSCQAFIYLIASFVPLPGAVGAVEGSYILFFNAVYGAPSVVALSAIVWRLFTFYLPILLGMVLTLLINNPDTWLARWIAKDNAEQDQRHASAMALRVQAAKAAGDAVASDVAGGVVGGEGATLVAGGVVGGEGAAPVPGAVLAAAPNGGTVRPMRILLVNHFPLEGSGSGTYTKNLAMQLVQRGHEVHVVMPENRTDFPRYEGVGLHPVFFTPEAASATLNASVGPNTKAGSLAPEAPNTADNPLPFNFPCFTTHPASVTTFGDLSADNLQAYMDAFQAAINEEVATFAPDVIHGQHVWILSALAADIGVPLVVTAHGTDLMGCETWPHLRTYADRAIQACSSVICISHDNEALVKELFPDQAHKVMLMRNGYNPDIFYPQALQPQDVLAPYGVDVSDASPVVLFAGKLATFKGVDVLLDAAALYEQTEPGAVTVVAGDGELRGSLLQQAQRLGLQRVHFIGNVAQDELCRLYNVADVSVVPSRREPFGLVAVEAMACGTPVVATDEGGLPDFVNETVGALVPVDDAAALAGAIAGTIDRLRGRVGASTDPAAPGATAPAPIAASAWRAAIAAYAATTHSQAAIIQELEALYNSVVNR